jgi:hypothetical protein
MVVFWVVALCSSVDVYRRFSRSCCPHHQGDGSDDEVGKYHVICQFCLKILHNVYVDIWSTRELLLQKLLTGIESHNNLLTNENIGGQDDRVSIRAPGRGTLVSELMIWLGLDLGTFGYVLRFEAAQCNQSTYLHLLRRPKMRACFLPRPYTPFPFAVAYCWVILTHSPLC